MEDVSAADMSLEGEGTREELQGGAVKRVAAVEKPFDGKGC